MIFQEAGLGADVQTLSGAVVLFIGPGYILIIEG